MPQTALTAAQAFDQLDDNLKLDKADLDAAIAFHNTLTDQLQEAQIIEGAFLQGSLARKTMLAPLRDVDKVALLRWGEDLGNGSSLRAAQVVADHLADLYPDDEVSFGKHCVKLDRGPDTFSFDIVPARDLGDDVEIIDTEQDRWEVSNTRSLIRIVAQRNQDCGGRFIRQVRFAKLFVREQLNGEIPGLHVEKYAFDAVTMSMAHDGALAAILAKGAELLDGDGYTDPTGVDMISERLDQDVRDRALTAFASAAAKAGDAVAAAKRDDHNAAIAIWYSMLGDNFPKPGVGEALAALAAGATPAETVARSAPVRTPTTRAWSSKAWH